MSSKISLRLEIQGLRAVAVGLVLLFHIWPDAVAGGYVGVDVFFVISGFLIVGSLIREAEKTGGVSLGDFYARRVRRLLPAASLVLLFVLGGMLIWLPQARWSDTLVQIAASALYVENWYLAQASVDYLASENAPSPVQHYWSLSIEEQFYIVWPVVMIGALWLARRLNLNTRITVGSALSLIFIASFAASVSLTISEPEKAYFMTHTRAWELALGGLLAIWPLRVNLNDPVRALVCMIGLTAIVSSGLFYRSGLVAFPGYTALLPTVGAALVITAGDFRLGFFRGLNYAPLQYIGKISYSVYLWHWPIIVFYLAIGNEIGLVEGVALIGLSIVASHVSYHFVEEWFRYPKQLVESRTLAFGLASVFCIVGAVAIGSYSIGRHTNAPVVAAGNVESYPGPAALVDGAYVPSDIPLKPAPVQLLSDKSVVYESGCHQDQENSEASVCEFGDASGKITIAVVGSSHSVNWLPTLDLLGQKNGWKIRSITKSACSFDRQDSDSCNIWHDNLLSYLSENPVDLIFVAEIARETVNNRSAKLITDRWQRFADLGLEILTIRPTPHLSTDPGDCIPDRIEQCVLPRQEAERANSVAMAAQQVPGVHVVDMTDALCAKDTCGPVVGNIIVFRDRTHLTATYARALAPYLETEIANAFPGLLPFSEGAGNLATVSQPNTANMICGPVGQSKALSRNYLLVRTGKKISLRRGNWRDQTSSFEIWEGAIDDNTVTISGRYMEGNPTVKSVELIGTIQDGSLVAAGTRGPRTCSLTWSLPTTN